MAIIDIFKKKSKETKEPQKISLEEVEDWYEKKKEEIRKDSSGYLDLIKEILKKHTKSLREELTALKEIDIDSTNEKERVKAIVKENLQNYIKHFEKLNIELEEIKKDEDMLEKINSSFYEFEKNSRSSYHKATYLVGKEIDDIKKTISELYKEINKIIKKNKPKIDALKNIKEIGPKIKVLKDVKEIKEELIGKKKNVDSTLESLYKARKTKQEEIKRLESSEAFIKKKKKKNLKSSLEEDLTSKIKETKSLLDFKGLARINHSIEKNMHLINEYKEDFNRTVREKGLFNLLELIDSSRQDKLKERAEEIEKIKSSIKDITIEDIGEQKLKSDLEKIDIEIEDEKKDKASFEKLEEKEDKELLDIKEMLKNELSQFNCAIN